MNVCPAIVIVPVRAAVPVLAATLKPTVPLPDPLAPLVTVIHVAFETADHVHPADTVTATDPLSPAATIDWLDGAIADEQTGCAAKVLDTALAPEPPGPTALTRDS